MNRFRNKNVAAGLFAGLAIGFVAAVLLAKDTGHPEKAEPASAAARLAAAERVCMMLHDAKDGAPKAHEGVEHTYLWSLRRMEAQRDVDATRDDRFSALEAHANRMREFSEHIAQLNKEGIASKFELASTRFYLAEAEELLARAVSHDSPSRSTRP